MLYWFLIGLGLTGALSGFVLMIVTQNREQKTWKSLLKEDKASAEERFKSLQKEKFSTPLRLSLILILAGMALGVLGIIVR